MALRLENKNALITGGASGIGRATAIRFAEEGANVFVADRHLAAAEETAAAVKKLGRKAIAYQVDTSDEAQVNAMVAQMVKDLGSVNIVVAAAGISHAHYGEEGQPDITFLSNKSFANWRKVLERQPRRRVPDRSRMRAGDDRSGQRRTHHKYRVSRRATADSRRRRVFRQQGRRLDADAGARDRVGAVQYHCQRHRPRLHQDSDDRAAFGHVRNMTPLMDRVPMKKMGEPIDVANTALFLASEEGRYYTGSILHPDGGIVMQ